MTLRPLLRGAIAPLAVAFVIAACTSGGAVASATPAQPSASVAPSSVDQYGSCPTSQPAPLAAGDVRTVTISTAKGDIVIEVKGSLSPIATGNFVALASCGFYNGVVFHRIVPSFVIQGGDGQYGRTPNVNANQVGTGGPGYTIKDEPVTVPYARGTVAMAKSSQPDSVGSQFFIVLSAEGAAQLEARYQIVGTVTSGMDAVDAIAAAADKELPSSPIAMTKVTVATP